MVWCLAPKDDDSEMILNEDVYAAPVILCTRVTDMHGDHHQYRLALDNIHRHR